MNGQNSLLAGEEGHCHYHCSQKVEMPDDRPDAIPGTRQNPVDVHGRILWTPPAPERSRATSSASFSRSAVRNGARPAATTTNGSAGAISVHSAGRLTSSPASSNTYTRSVRVHPVPELPDQGPALRRQAELGATRHRHSPLKSEEPVCYVPGANSERLRRTLH